MSSIRKQFDKIMQDRCLPEELCCTIEICHKSDERMRDMINYILKNDLDCKLMNEDSEEGEVAFYNFNRISQRSLLYEGIRIDIERFKPKDKN